MGLARLSPLQLSGISEWSSDRAGQQQVLDLSGIGRVALSQLGHHSGFLGRKLLRLTLKVGGHAEARYSVGSTATLEAGGASTNRDVFPVGALPVALPPRYTTLH
jgi:hypothetical protein